MRVQYEIRRAVLGDLERILQIENASFGPEAYDRKLFASYLRKCGALFLVVEHRGKVCGYIISCLRGTSSPLRAELVSVAVDPARRGKGVASALLEGALRRLRRRRVAQLQLVVRVSNQPALAFYEKYGFEPKRRVPHYYEDGGDGIAMVRPVTPP